MSTSRYLTYIQEYIFCRKSLLDLVMASLNFPSSNPKYMYGTQPRNPIQCAGNQFERCGLIDRDECQGVWLTGYLFKSRIASKTGWNCTRPLKRDMGRVALRGALLYVRPVQSTYISNISGDACHTVRAVTSCDAPCKAYVPLYVCDTYWSNYVGNIDVEGSRLRVGLGRAERRITRRGLGTFLDGRVDGLWRWWPLS